MTKTFSFVEEKEQCLSMNQVVEKLCNLSLAQSWCEDMQNIISYVSSKYEANATKAISYVILGCFSLLISVLVRRTRSKPKPKPRIRPNRLEATRSFIVRELHSGYPALDRLMTEQYEHPSALDSAHALIRELQKDLPDLLILQVSYIYYYFLHVFMFQINVRKCHYLMIFF